MIQFICEKPMIYVKHIEREMINYPYQIPQNNFQLPIIPKPPVQMCTQTLRPYEPLTISLPLQEYKLSKIVPIPFDPRESKGAKFDCLQDALEFIGKHCITHHNYFTKQISKKYLEFCRILDGPTGKYIVMKHFGKKEFDSAFNKVRQEIEYQKFSK